MHTLTDCATRTDRREHRTVQILSEIDRADRQAGRQADKPCRKTDRQTNRGLTDREKHGRSGEAGAARLNPTPANVVCFKIDGL